MAPPFDLELATIGNRDHDQQQYDHHHLFGNYLELPQSSFSSTTSSLSSPVFSAPAQLIQGSISDHHYYREPQDFQFQLLEADHIVASGGSRDQDQAVDDQRNHESRRAENASVKWMSSKMRIMRKMTSTNQDQAISSVTTTDQSTAPVNFSSSFSSRNFEERQKPHPSSPLGTDVSSNAPNTPIRVCSDCNTTKTPLWRSGPRGPKSLCNACGIRQRKARRAMAAAAAAANGTSLAVEPAPSLIKMSKANKLKDNKTIPFKKRCHKLNTSSSPSSRGKSKTKIRFEDFTITGVNQNNPGGPTSTTAFQPVFPQDEKEAAILLMALSCGLVHG